MIRKDYILRMIEEIGKMIAVMLGLLNKGEIKQAQKLYAEGLKRSLDLDEDAILNMEVEQLRTIFEDRFGESYEGLEVLAGLLAAGADMHVKNEQYSKAKSSYIKAMQLYELVESESATYSVSRQAQMTKLMQLIAQLD